MAGNTSRIDAATLRVQWSSYVPMGAICQHWTITVHQLVRLRVAWDLPPRNDRKRRYKPSRDERLLDPDADEIAASESSLDLAPMVAERVTVVQAAWTPTEWAERRAVKPEPFRLARIELPDEAREVMDDAGEVDW
jgi:hypothetical protein